MNLKKALVVVGLAAGAVGVPGIGLAAGAVGVPGIAAAQQDAGFYAGGAVGQTKAKDACTDLTDLAPFVGSCDDKDTAWKIFGGYQFNRYIGAEIGYVDLGKVTANGTILGVPVSANIKAKGFEALAVGTLPINEQFAAYGKAGFFRWDVDASAVVGGVAVAASEKGTDLTYGIGLKYNFTKNLAVRVEYQRYKDLGDENTTGKSNVDVIGVGLVFKF